MLWQSAGSDLLQRRHVLVVHDGELRVALVGARPRRPPAACTVPRGCLSFYLYIYFYMFRTRRKGKYRTLTPLKVGVGVHAVHVRYDARADRFTCKRRECAVRPG